MAEIRPLSPGAPAGPQTLHPQAPRPAAPLQPAGPAKIAPVPSQTVKPANLEPISLIEESAAPTQSKIKAFSSATGHGVSHAWKRQPTIAGHGAIRVRSFHGRLSDEGMEFMDNKINEWIDEHPDVEVKFVTTTIGTYEGKIREQALIVNVWY